jgi:hypothetical protein
MISLASRLTVTALTVVATTSSMSSVAQAAPKPHVGNPTASCVGLTTSEHAVNDGGRFVAAQIADVRSTIAAVFGLPFGAGVRHFAKTHAGTHAACEATLP